MKPTSDDNFKFLNVFIFMIKNYCIISFLFSALFAIKTVQIAAMKYWGVILQVSSRTNDEKHVKHTVYEFYIFSARTSAQIF